MNIKKTLRDPREWQVRNKCIECGFATYYLRICKKCGSEMVAEVDDKYYHMKRETIDPDTITGVRIYHCAVSVSNYERSLKEFGNVTIPDIKNIDPNDYYHDETKSIKFNPNLILI